MKIYENITNIKGIGTKTAALFGKLGVNTVEDLLHMYPRTYLKYKDPVSVSSCFDKDTVSLRLFIIEDFRFKKMKTMTIGSGFATDGNSRVYITFFNTPYYKDKLIKGKEYIFYGKITVSNNSYKMEQPVFFTEEEYNSYKSTLQPIYSLTKGLSNKVVSKSVKACMEYYDYLSLYDEYLPEEAVRRFDLLSRKEALSSIHFPNNAEDAVNARKRLAFDELFLFLLLLRSMKSTSKIQASNFVMIETAGVNRLIESLPYRLTNAQLKTVNEIKEDLTSGNVMNRLVQGDVGSGKTIVGFLALLMCVENGYQGAMMAPTEILATQHYENLCALVKQYNLPIKPVLLTGSVTPKNKSIIYERINSGDVNVVIGTHALIQDKINFKNLALVITDEQHRFGVRQRQTLSDKALNPHVLVMSATPIPRTLAIVIYGDLSMSVIDEKPSNRLPIKNCVVNRSYRNKAYEFITSQVKEGRQCYVICPMVEESEGLPDVENVIDYCNMLKSKLPSFVRVDYLHGKMKSNEKQLIMDNFLSHNIDVLVSTTVIEVGVDVPNATVMMIENAQRFGLSQLHQLRGRIGRGEHQSYTIFVNTEDDNENNKRLEILNKSNDGFYIAKEDLKLRGQGDIFGIRQSGDINFEIADLYEDSEMILNINSYLDEIDTGRTLINDSQKALIKAYLDENMHKFIDFKTI